MRRMNRVLCTKMSILRVIFTLFLFNFSAQAQEIKGKWYGIASVNASSASNTFMCELILEPKPNNRIEGYMNYYFRNGYFTNKISGTYNKQTRELKLNTFPIIYYRTTQLGLGIDCNMLGSFTLKASRVESSFMGSFYSREHAYTCPELTVKFIKAEREIPIEKLETELVKEEIAEPETKKPEPKLLANLNLRRKEIVRILDVSEDSVKIDLYDNGDFDNDSVTVYYNGQVQVSKQLLETRKPITFKVSVDSLEENNELIMFAENLGSIPPNAALMVITDKHHRYEIPLISNYIKNAAIRLRKTSKNINAIR